VAFFKEMADRTWRVSMRSKGNVDVRAIASQFGGGGHVNAAGCSVTGELPGLQQTFMRLLGEAVEVQSSKFKV
jgi:bifunctional oligoribonuclease and PAP phosphatase NrnA